MPAISNSAISAPDIERLPDSALLTRRQLSEISSFALITLKVWAKNGRGPRITVVEGRPRYRVSDVRAWMGASS
ncbi:hypothetical protein ASF58_05925 [Methylobacterium sp. Leaf125]|uniref:hypothetical protein n=1 Tax=Methylobacterium sp. Leaf125 TaxID=1736265 RepID=UPI0006F5CDD2|nr:hypothetical protein [Methylobacterium sp. Leaf125]KQQ48789.1 hypothetical protein ASF58_05925 [Methylobacterium sp. Leaf125]